MELDESELNEIIDDMIRILEDSEELGAMCDAKEAVVNLNQVILIINSYSIILAKILYVTKHDSDLDYVGFYQ
jgi:hypothetical protein